MAEKVKKEKRGIFKRIGGFFKEVRIETFKRIIWPTPKQVLNNTIIVIGKDYNRKWRDCNAAA